MRKSVYLLTFPQMIISDLTAGDFIGKKYFNHKLNITHVIIPPNIQKSVTKRLIPHETSQNHTSLLHTNCDATKVQNVKP